MDALPTTGGIYIIRNLVNGKTYIGQTVNFRKRWGKHRGELRRRTHRNEHLTNAWYKYGEDSFVFEPLEHVGVPVGLSVPEMREFLKPYEQRWMDKLKPEYNKAPAAGSQLGYKFSDEARAKVSEAGRGRVQSEETKAKRSATLMGHRHSPETIEKLRVAARNRAPVSDATRKKLSDVAMGKPRPDVSEALKGRKRPQHVVDAMHAGRDRWQAEQRALKESQEGMTSGNSHLDGEEDTQAG